jgi:transcriptional regulator with XRE-family HTH domain
MTPFAQPMTFGALILHLRAQRGWTQEQLARLSGITVGSVSNLERERTLLPNADTVERLAAAFGLEPEELDPRWLAERVIAQASSLARRQAIKAVLELSERQVHLALAQLAVVAKPAKPERKRRRR